MHRRSEHHLIIFEVLRLEEIIFNYLSISWIYVEFLKWSKSLISLLCLLHFFAFKRRVGFTSKYEEWDATKVREENKWAQDISTSLWITFDIKCSKQWLCNGSGNCSTDCANEQESTDGEGLVFRGDNINEHGDSRSNPILSREILQSQHWNRECKAACCWNLYHNA